MCKYNEKNSVLYHGAKNTIVQRSTEYNRTRNLFHGCKIIFDEMNVPIPLVYSNQIAAFSFSAMFDLNMYLTYVS